MSSYGSTTVSQLAELAQQESIELIDVRTPVEYREVHATMAENVPLDTLPNSPLMRDPNAIDRRIYVICRGGNRSEMACQKLVAAGFSDVVNVEGGTSAWDGAGLPVVRGKKAIGLERQVRILAGSIVLAGSLAALATGNVYFAGVPAFIGAGLVFAGVTDTCGMGMMLAKMPWNQCSTQTCSAQPDS